jgi:hypothetical protein
MSTPPSPEAPVDGAIDDAPLVPAVADAAVITLSDPGAAEPSLGLLGLDDEMLGPLDDGAAVMSVAGDVTSLPLSDVGVPASIVGGVTTLGVTTSCGGLVGADAAVVAASDEGSVCGPTSVSFCGTTVTVEITGAVALAIMRPAS